MKFLKQFLLPVVSLSITSPLAALQLELPQTAEAQGWLFRVGSAAITKITAGSGETVPDYLTVTDFFGNAQTVKTDKNQEATTIRLPLTATGFFTVSSDGKIIQPFAVLPPKNNIDGKDNPFGVNFHLTRIPLAEAKREVEIAQYIGYDWGRGCLFDWDDARDGDTAKLFARHQPLIDFLAASKLHILHGIYFFPPQHTGAPAHSEYIVYSRTAPEDLTPATQFAELIAKRLPFVTYWEVGNEPNADIFWRGRWKNFVAGNDREVIKDYVDFLAACSQGFRQGNPGVKVLYAGLTSAGPESGSYPNFLSTSLHFGAHKYFDIMNAHYKADLGKYRQIMGQYQVCAPIWVTEIGSSSSGNGRTERTQVIADLTEQIVQLAEGAQKVFKYDLRDDGVNPNDQEHNFGLLKRNFNPKPSLVANAVMISQLADSKFVKALNLIGDSNAGYLKAFEFQNAAGQTVNAVWLSAASKAKIKLTTDETTITVTDCMGNARQITPSNRIVELEIADLPIFIGGKLISRPGEPVYPHDILMKSIAVPLKNGDFEEGGLNGWGNNFDPAVGKTACTGKTVHRGSGAAEITVNAPGEKSFKCFFQRVDIKSYQAMLKPGQYLKMKFSIYHRRSEVTGRGSTVALLFYNDKKERFGGCEDSYRIGSHDWKQVELEGKIPANCEMLGVEYYLAPASTGQIQIDNVSLTLEIWGPDR